MLAHWRGQYLGEALFARRLHNDVYVLLRLPADIREHWVHGSRLDQDDARLPFVLP